MKKMIYTTAEVLDAELEIAQFGPEDLTRAVPCWSLANAAGEVVAQGQLPARDLPCGELYHLGAIKVPLAMVNAPAKLVLTVGIDGRDARNAWEVFVYPHAGPQAGEAKAKREGVVVTPDPAAAKAALAKGGKVLWMPSPIMVRNDPARPLVAGFSPIFWNTAWTNWQPPHTLGILCDPKHPALAGFPTDFHSNWQWWEIQQNAQPFILTKHAGLHPIVQVIDDWVTNRKLGYVFEAKVGEGRLMAWSGPIVQDWDKHPAAHQLFVSLLDYMATDKFAPAVELAPDDLDGLARTPSE